MSDLVPMPEPEERGLARFSGAFSLAEMSDEQFNRNVDLLRKAQDRLLKIMHDVMREGVDYGNVPGVDKPVLAQPGAETLCNLFNLKAELLPVFLPGDGETAPAVRWDVACNIHAGSLEGPIVGTGHGTCNSWEAKYRYRNAERICPKCGKPAIIKGKAEYGGGWLCFAKKGGCGAKFADGDQAIEGQHLGQTENPDPHDLSNTILKMAEKRAHVDATKRTTGASAVFTQDLEEQGDLSDAPAPKPKPSARERVAQRAAAARNAPTPEPPDDFGGWVEGEVIGEPAPVAKPQLERLRSLLVDAVDAAGPEGQHGASAEQLAAIRALALPGGGRPMGLLFNLARDANGRWQLTSAHADALLAAHRSMGPDFGPAWSALADELGQEG